jgi:hypothetical protein
MRGARVEQLSRAADPAWALGGAGLETPLPPVVRPILLIIGLVLAFFAPADDAGASVGAVLVVFGQSLRMFGVLFLVPATLRVRRELALIAATLIATYTLPGLWMGIAIVVAALVASRRYPALREPLDEGLADRRSTTQGSHGDPIVPDAGGYPDSASAVGRLAPVRPSTASPRVGRRAGSPARSRRAAPRPQPE